jgi:hypothetical protein
LVILGGFLCPFSVFAGPSWVEYAEGRSYDKKSFRKVKANVYQVTALTSGEKGYATLKARVDCATGELFYGTVTMYDKSGHFLFSDGARGFKGGQPTGKADQDLVEVICRAGGTKGRTK